jgi:hypothetical protein
VKNGVQLPSGKEGIPEGSTGFPKRVQPCGKAAIGAAAQVNFEELRKLDLAIQRKRKALPSSSESLRLFAA